MRGSGRDDAVQEAPSRASNPRAHPSSSTRPGRQGPAPGIRVLVPGGHTAVPGESNQGPLLSGEAHLPAPREQPLRSGANKLHGLKTTESHG